MARILDPEVHMKRILLFAGLAILMIGAAAVWAQSTQPKAYKVVFDLTTDDAQDQAAVLRWLREVSSANPQSEAEVVLYGRGVALVVPGRSTMVDDVRQAVNRPHVSFKVCEISMRNQKVDKSELLSGVGTVPDGIGEIVARQRDGWGYIKAVAH
jgi:intracellular sulfur oxidation DsrE/DsrF family protein